MKGTSFRLDVFLFMLWLSLPISCSVLTGSVAAPHESRMPISPEMGVPLLNGQKITFLTLKTHENKSFDQAIPIFYRGMIKLGHAMNYEVRLDPDILMSAARSALKT